MKYLNRDSFQVGGYSRKYADNWQAIFGAAKAKLDAEKAASDSSISSDEMPSPLEVTEPEKSDK